MYHKYKGFVFYHVFMYFLVDFVGLFRRFVLTELTDLLPSFRQCQIDHQM